MNTAATARRPDAMGQFAYRDRRDFEKAFGAELPDLIQSADSHVSERAVRVDRDIDVVGRVLSRVNGAARHTPGLADRLTARTCCAAQGPRESD